MWRRFAGPIAAAARDSLHQNLSKGLVALVWGMAVAALVASGGLLLLVAALMGLSMLFGPIGACAVLGFALISAAFLIATLRRDRPALAVPVAPLAAVPLAAVPGPAPFPLPETPLGQLAFILGFAAAHAVLRPK